MSALDQQAKAVLEALAKSGRPAYHQLDPKDARQLFLETRPLSTPTPPEIGSVRDVVAEGPRGHIPLRVYRPAGLPASTPLPAYVYFTAAAG
jgi:acetyl esterase